MRGRSLSLVVISSLLIPHGAAFAQEAELGDEEPADAPAPEEEQPTDGQPAAPVKDPKLAKKWKDAGAQLVGKGDRATKQKKLDDAKTFYENAITAYTNALASSDDLTLHYDIGLIADKLGKFDEAARRYRTLVKAGAGVRPDLLKKATTKFDEATAKIGVVILAVKPDDATVSLAGADLGKTPLPEPLFLLPGNYTFSFQADGYQPKDVELAVEAGGETEKSVELEEMKVIVAAPEPDDERTVAVVSASPPSKVPLVVGAVVTVGALGVAVVTGLMARSEHDTFVAQGSTSDEREDARVAGENLALTTDILLGVGVAGALFTSGWYFFKYRPAMHDHGEETAPSSRGAPSMTMAPWTTGSGGGFAVGGSF